VDPTGGTSAPVPTTCTAANEPSPGCGAPVGPSTISCPTITLSPSLLPNGTAGTAYNQTVTASPSGTYTFGVTSGSLPTGLSLNTSTGQISGTPTATGTFNFRITATGFGGCTGFEEYTI